MTTQKKKERKKEKESSSSRGRVEVESCRECFFLSFFFFFGLEFFCLVEKKKNLSTFDVFGWKNTREKKSKKKKRKRK